MKNISLDCFKKQKLQQDLINENSPYYVKGEWKFILENKFPDIQKILSFKEDDFYNIEHVSMRIEKERHLHIASRISNYVKEKDIICEIGAGIGGVCFNLLDSFYKNNKYVIFDIPETLLICHTFLSQKFQNKFNIFYFDGNKDNFDFTKILKNNDIILLPHYMIENLSKKFFNVFINTGSFCEMPELTCKNYVNKILKLALDQSKFYLEYRKPDRIQNNISAIEHKEEICVFSILKQEKLKNILLENSKYTTTYYEAVYEN